MFLLIKRLIDITVSLMGLIILSPFLVIIGVLLAIQFRGNPFFTQVRPGKDEKLFTLIKFRTMSNERDKKGNLLPDKDRLTGFGMWVRRLSLDEFPQLINVLKGDMSLVGPRPLLVQYLERYSPEQARRHEVRPGITGWAQINGRNAISWERKFELDVWYVDNASFILDLKILILTFWKVLKREGISEGGEVTMSEFRGK